MRSIEWLCCRWPWVTPKHLKLWQWYLQYGMTVVDGFLLCVWSNWLCATSAESHPVFVFSIFVKVFLVDFSGRKYFRFTQVFITILSSALNICFHILFHCIIITHKVTQWSVHCSVTQLWCHQSVK